MTAASSDPDALSRPHPERDLDPRLGERCIVHNERAIPEDGEFVVYWMRTAVRGHENPALEVAAAYARRLALPFFVYHALDERYPHASDRHHRFILEGARDVAGELAKANIGYALHVARPGHRGDYLRQLGRRAALLVTEELPVEPLRTWTEGLARDLPAPVISVDTACVLPMPRVRKAYTRAFEFRRATQKDRRDRLRLDWPEVRAEGFLPDLPFAPVDPVTADLEALIAACQIDHSLPPVAHTPGGSLAGYARWDEFRATGLKGYARRRNDATRLDGTSRMSAYLHYGHVSPFRIIRDAASAKGQGPEKYLDEILIWRELAHVFCFHRRDLDSLGALPEWARETLDEHRDDARSEIIDAERLARGETGQPLWDLCQKSLLRQGELHNNVRMTWGKALLDWSATPEQALARAIDLNHRFALDGRDPSSYGGLLWCFGQFDRPFTPEAPVRGQLRPREPEQHEERLDLEAYRRAVLRPRSATPSVAIIGGGLAGLSAARTLVDQGLEVRVFDKGRGPGGRMSSRRCEMGAVDHGAQYFRVHDQRFARAVEAWREAGIVAPWEGPILKIDAEGERRPAKGEGRFVPQPRMSSLTRHLADAVDLRVATRIAAIRRDAESSGWTLESETGDCFTGFDHVIVTAPAEQAQALFEPVAPDLAARMGEIDYAPSLATMMRFADPLPTEHDAIICEQGPISWAVRNEAKPGRGPETNWVVHASAAWSESHFEDDLGEVAETLRHALGEILGLAMPEPLKIIAHRWRYALVTRALGEDCLFDRASGLGYAGDGCLGPRVEAAWLSGQAIAGRILGQAPALQPQEQLELF
jgi:photolyase PhrII